MQVTRDGLIEYYKLLTDDELCRMLNSGELTAIAQNVARAELNDRGIIFDTRAGGSRAVPEAFENAGAGRSASPTLLVQIRGVVEAELLRGRLCAEGVDATIVDAPMIRPLSGGISRILVPEHQLEQAQRILQIIQSERIGGDASHGAPTNAGRMIILVFLGLALLIVAFGVLLPGPRGPTDSIPNWGFRSGWKCSTATFDPICFQQTPRQARP